MAKIMVNIQPPPSTLPAVKAGRKDEKMKKLPLLFAMFAVLAGCASIRPYQSDKKAPSVFDTAFEHKRDELAAYDRIITVSNPLPFAVRVKLECEALAGGILSSRSLNPSPIIWVEVPPRSAKDMWAVTPDAIPCRMLDWVGVF
jgi:hypothetical protein